MSHLCKLIFLNNWVHYWVNVHNEKWRRFGTALEPAMKALLGQQKVCCWAITGRRNLTYRRYQLLLDQHCRWTRADIHWNALWTQETMGRTTRSTREESDTMCTISMYVSEIKQHKPVTDRDDPKWGYLVVNNNDMAPNQKPSFCREL